MSPSLSPLSHPFPISFVHSILPQALLFTLALLASPSLSFCGSSLAAFTSTLALSSTSLPCPSTSPPFPLHYTPLLSTQHPLLYNPWPLYACPISFSLPHSLTAFLSPPPPLHSLLLPSHPLLSFSSFSMHIDQYHVPGFAVLEALLYSYLVVSFFSCLISFHQTVSSSCFDY